MAKAKGVKSERLGRQREYIVRLRRTADSISKALGSNFLGFYVIGSFVMGDWNPEKSDIDFIVISRKPLNKKEAAEIGKLHLALSKSDLGKKLDGAYTYLEQLQQKRFEERTGSVENHEFKPDCPCHLSADNILCLLQYGKCIRGVPIRELCLSVSDEELSQGERDMLREATAETDEKEDFHALYDVLVNVLRCIYTLETKKLPTKPMAIEYCKDLLGRDLHGKVRALQDGKIKEFRIDRRKLKSIVAYGLSIKNQSSAVGVSFGTTCKHSKFQMVPLTRKEISHPNSARRRKTKKLNASEHFS
jgi:predicted nucleotidyltransferase